MQPIVSDKRERVFAVPVTIKAALKVGNQLKTNFMSVAHF
jgi:hypothetical protein